MPYRCGSTVARNYLPLIPADDRQAKEQAKQDVLDALQRLSQQEARVQKVTRDLELGKNQ